LEIDLHSVHVITATETQGRFGNGQGVEFAEAYLLEYWRPRLGKWVRYRDIKGEEVSTTPQSEADAAPGSTGLLDQANLLLTVLLLATPKSMSVSGHRIYAFAL
jgi:hypothetical protein